MRDIHRERQTDTERDTERYTERYRERQIDRDRYTEREIYTERERDTEREREIQREREISLVLTSRQPHRVKESGRKDEEKVTKAYFVCNCLSMAPHRKQLCSSI